MANKFVAQRRAYLLKPDAYNCRTAARRVRQRDDDGALRPLRRGLQAHGRREVALPATEVAVAGRARSPTVTLDYLTSAAPLTCSVHQPLCQWSRSMSRGGSDGLIRRDAKARAIPSATPGQPAISVPIRREHEYAHNKDGEPQEGPAAAPAMEGLLVGGPSQLLVFAGGI